MPSASDPQGARQAIERLWDAGGGVGRFALPDGELGRPGDNLYRLTFIEARVHKLLIELDDQLLLVVTEPVVAAVEDRAVDLDFQHLTFDWQGYGDLTPHLSTYRAGQLRFFRPFAG